MKTKTAQSIFSATTVCLGAIAIGLASPLSAQAVSVYSLTPIGTFGGASSQAFDINDAGQVVGWSTDSGGIRRAYIWENNLLTQLNVLTGGSSQAQGINNQGQVVGFENLAGGARTALLWNSPTTPTDLGNLGGNFAAGYGINESGQVTGVSRTATGGSTLFATLWDGGTITNLDSNSSFAWDINNLGQSVGSADIGTLLRATVWESNGTATLLPFLGSGDFAQAQGINDSGQVVGYSGIDPSNNLRRATLWQGGSVFNLGLLPGDETSTALRINQIGQVVGWSRGSNNVVGAFLWENGEIFDLNALTINSQGWQLEFAWGINNNRQIAGYGRDPNNQIRAFLLTPVTSVPEPSLVLGLLTVGLLGAIARRQR